MAFFMLFWAESEDYPQSSKNLYLWDFMVEIQHPKKPSSNHHDEVVKKQFVINSGR